MTRILKIATASALALATAAPAYAQQYRPTPEYQRQYQDYVYQRDRYEDRREDYREARQDYREARRDYERRLGDWERARARYDARYGYGAYARRYPRPSSGLISVCGGGGAPAMRTRSPSTVTLPSAISRSATDWTRPAESRLRTLRHSSGLRL